MEQKFYRLGVSLILFSVLFLVWLSLAVGINGPDGESFDRFYLVVIGTGLAAAVSSRFRPRGMFHASMLMAGTQLGVALAALALGKHHSEASPALEILGVNGIFCALYLGAAWLFRRASHREFAVRSVYTALNRDHAERAVQHMSQEVERIEPESFEGAAQFRGRSQMIEHFKEGRATWAEGSCTPEQVISKGERTVALVHVHVRQKEKTEWIDARIADGFIFKDGQITQFRTFLSRSEALEWAGIPTDSKKT